MTVQHAPGCASESIPWCDCRCEPTPCPVRRYGRDRLMASLTCGCGVGANDVKCPWHQQNPDPLVEHGIDGAGTPSLEYPNSSRFQEWGFRRNSDGVVDHWTEDEELAREILPDDSELVSRWVYAQMTDWQDESSWE